MFIVLFHVLVANVKELSHITMLFSSFVYLWLQNKTFLVLNADEFGSVYQIYLWKPLTNFRDSNLDQIYRMMFWWHVNFSLLLEYITTDHLRHKWRHQDILWRHLRCCNSSWKGKSLHNYYQLFVVTRNSINCFNYLFHLLIFMIIIIIIYFFALSDFHEITRPRLGNATYAN